MERQWTYLKFYQDDIASLDACVVSLFKDAKFETFGSETDWFFLRYVDFAGPQLRLRFRSQDLDIVRWARTWYLEFLEECAVADDIANSRRAAPSFGGRGRRGVDVCSYVPEIKKYGTIEIVREIEDLWAAQCRKLMHSWTEGTKLDRLKIYGHTATVLTGSFLGEESRSASMRAHAWYWMQNIRRDSEKFTAQLLLFERLLGSGPDVKGGDMFVDDFEKFLPGILVMNSSRTLSHYMFNLLHILANRLGISPMEEAMTMLASSKQVR